MLYCPLLLRQLLPLCSHVGGHGQGWVWRHCEHRYLICCNWHDEKEVSAHASAKVYPDPPEDHSLKVCLFLDRVCYAVFWLIFPLWTLIDIQMDARDMSFFPDESFDSVIDKGTLFFYSLSVWPVGNLLKLDILFHVFGHLFVPPYLWENFNPLTCSLWSQGHLIPWWYVCLPHCLDYQPQPSDLNVAYLLLWPFQCGSDAPTSADQMLREVSRLCSSCPQISLVEKIPISGLPFETIVVISPVFHLKLQFCSLDAPVFACRLLKPGGIYMLVINASQWWAYSSYAFLFGDWSIRNHSTVWKFPIADNLWWPKCKDASFEPPSIQLADCSLHYM